MLKSRKLNPPKKQQEETIPLYLICSHSECHSFRAVYERKSRHGKRKQQTLYPLHSKIKADLVLHSSCFQPTSTTSKIFGFFSIRREVCLDAATPCEWPQLFLRSTGTPGSAHSRVRAYSQGACSLATTSFIFC